MPVWLSAATCLAGIAGTAFCLTKVGERKKSNARMGAIICAAVVFGAVSVFAALYLLAAVLLLSGIS